MPEDMLVTTTVNLNTGAVDYDHKDLITGPVYDILLPILRDCSFDLKDWLHNNPDDSDAVDVRTILERTITQLEGLDTTVRETY